MCCSFILVLLFATCLESVVSSDEDFPFPKKCGIQAFEDKIIHGDLAKIDEYPWMALLKFQTEGGAGYGCGGALINKRYVLTAAHCVVGKFGEPVEVTLGETDVDSKIDCEPKTKTPVCADPPQFIAIEEVIKHPDYVKDSPQKLHDIALIRLKSEPTFSDFVKPICVPNENIQKDIFKSANKLDIAGWGRTKHNPLNKVKRKAVVPRIENEICSQNRTYKIAESQICAGGGLQDTCSGDSGGPLMGLHPEEDDLIYYATGIISFGSKMCGAGIPSVYTNVATYYDWIVKNIKP